MLDSQTISLLKSGFDFTEAELVIYDYLLSIKDTTAEDICEKTGVPKGRIYDVLNSLLEKGFIEVSYGRPKKYFVSNPQSSVSNALKTKINKLAALEREAILMSRKLSSDRFSEQKDAVEINQWSELSQAMSRELQSSTSVRVFSSNSPMLLIRNMKFSNEVVKISYRIFEKNLLERLESGSASFKIAVDQKELESILKSPRRKDDCSDFLRNFKAMSKMGNVELRVASNSTADEFFKCAVFDNCSFINMDPKKGSTYLYFKSPKTNQQFIRLYDDFFAKAEPLTAEYIRKISAK